jgi:Flp pilus assembly protein TadG
MMILRRNPARRGGSAVEFAALAPFLFWLAAIGTDWARLLHYTIVIEGCARAGAAYAADPSTQSESRFTSTSDAAIGSAPGLTPTPTVVQSATTVDGRSMVSVTVSMPFTTLTNFPGVPKSQYVVRTVEMRIMPITPN